MSEAAWLARKAMARMAKMSIGLKVSFWAPKRFWLLTSETRKRTNMMAEPTAPPNRPEKVRKTTEASRMRGVSGSEGIWFWIGG